MTSRLEFRSVLANDLDAVAKREPLIRIGRDGRVERRMPDNNAGSRNDPPNVLVVAVPKFGPKRLDSAIMCLKDGEIPLNDSTCGQRVF